MMPCDLNRCLISGRAGIDLAELELDALTDRARANTGRVERLDDLQCLFDFRGGAFDLRTQCVGDFVQRFGDVAVIADGIDDRPSDGEFTWLESWDFELPQQMFLHE